MVGERKNSPIDQNSEVKTMNVMHFDSPEERIKFVRGKFEEIILEKAEDKPKKAKKSVKKAKKEDKDGEDKAE